MNNGILLVTSEFPPGPGGIGHHAYCLAKELSMRFKVRVLTNGDYVSNHELLKFDNNQDFRIRRFRRLGFLTQFLRIIDFLRVLITERPEKIIYSGLFPIWMVNFGKTFLLPNAKHIAIVHGHEPIFGSNSHKKLTAYSIKKFDKILPVSKFSRENIIKAIGSLKKADILEIIPNGIDLGNLSTWERKSSSEKTDLDKMVYGFPKLLTVGHTSPRKGQHNVIRALPEILKNFPETFYYIVGRDVNNSHLKQLAEELGVKSRVIFIPPIANHFDLCYYYKNANIFMLLSENQPNGDVEGFGIVALEANYFGLPVIGAKGCGVEDAVSDGFSGFLVDSKNPKEIANSLQLILENGDKFNENAKKYVLNFGWNEIVKQYEDILCAE